MKLKLPANFSSSNLLFYNKLKHAFFLALFVFMSISLKAQNATTTINLVLADVLSIDPASAANGGIVDFNYASVQDYNSEKTLTIPNSLVITFSKPFDLKVKANGEHFESGTNSIPVNVLTIKRNESSRINGSSAPVVLSTQDQVLVSGASSGSKLNLDLDYIIPQSKSSSQDFLGKPSGIYTQKITYTATAL